jgi:hypothetical protein
VSGELPQTAPRCYVRDSASGANAAAYDTSGNVVGSSSARRCAARGVRKRWRERAVGSRGLESRRPSAARCRRAADSVVRRLRAWRSAQRRGGLRGSAPPGRSLGRPRLTRRLLRGTPGVSWRLQERARDFRGCAAEFEILFQLKSSRPNVTTTESVFAGIRTDWPGGGDARLLQPGCSNAAGDDEDAYPSRGGVAGGL